MPTSPDPEGEPVLMTIPDIVERYGVSRTTIHNYRRTGRFPRPVAAEGSTRLRFVETEVDRFFTEEAPRQGERTDLKQPPAE